MEGAPLRRRVEVSAASMVSREGEPQEREGHAEWDTGPAACGGAAQGFAVSPEVRTGKARQEKRHQSTPSERRGEPPQNHWVRSV